MLLTENDSKGIVEADSERVKPLDYEALRKKAGGQKPLCPYVVELEELRQDPYKAPSYRVFETAYHTDNMVAVSADGYKLEKKRHGKVYVLHSDAQMAQFKDIVADYQMCLQELGEAIAAYPRCSKAIPEGTEYVVQVPIVGQKLPTWMAPYIERFRLLGGNATLKVEPLAEEFDEEGNKKAYFLQVLPIGSSQLAEEFDEEGNKKDQSQRIGKDAAIVLSDEEWEELSELYDQCVYESQRLEKFLAEAGSYEDLVCSTYADTSEIQAQINSLKAKIKQTKSNLKAVNSAKSTASFNEQLRKLEKELEKLKGDLEVVENGNFYLVTLEQEKAPDPNNFSWIICADQANPEAISKANIEQLEYILKCLQKPFHPFADKGRVSAVKAELAKKKECDNSTSVQGSALALPSPDSNSDSNLSDSLKLTSTVEESSASDIPESKTTGMLNNSPKPSEANSDIISTNQEESISSRHLLPASPSLSGESDREPQIQETVSPQLLTSSIDSDPNTSSSKTCQDSSVADLNQVTNDSILNGLQSAYPRAGTISNGKPFPQPTLEVPGVEKDSLLLASPTAMSNGNGNPPGSTALEDQLRKMGAIGPKEVANPEFLEAGSGIPLGWTNPQDERSALEFLQEMESSEVAEKPLATRSIQESQASACKGSSNSIQELKALSLWQPWASLIITINPETGEPFKQFETCGENMKTNYRGKLIIHAAQKADKSIREVHENICGDLDLDLNFDDLPRGCAIAICDLTDCIQMTEEFIEEQSADEIICGDWQVGRYAWKLENVRRLDPPIPMKGQQGLWNVDPEVLKIGELSYFESEAVAVEVIEPDFYDALDQDDAENLRFDASEIRSGMNTLWETTVRLAEVSERAQERCREIDKKKELPRGTTYDAWVAYEFQGEGQKLAYAKQELERHRRIKRAFDSVPSEVMNLIVPSARLLLASDNYQNAREEAIALARCGTEITVKLAKDLIADSPTSHKPKKGKSQPALPPANEAFSQEVTYSKESKYPIEGIKNASPAEIEDMIDKIVHEKVVEAMQDEGRKVHWEEIAKEEAKEKVSEKLEKYEQAIKALAKVKSQNVQLQQQIEQLEAQLAQVKESGIVKENEELKRKVNEYATVSQAKKQVKIKFHHYEELGKQKFSKGEQYNLYKELLDELMRTQEELSILKSAPAVANSPQLELVTNASTAEVNSEQMPIGA